VLRALWAPRLRESIGWIAATMRDMQAEGRQLLVAEQKGEAVIDGIRLHGTVDRIDRLTEALGGGLAIVDYKTGAPPPPKQVAGGYAMQLGLLGLIALEKGFPGVAGVPALFEYWSLTQKDGVLGYIAPATGKRVKIEPQEFVAMARRNFAEAVATWLTGDAPFTAKLHPALAPYGDYDQLMRLDEWYGRQGETA
jgi:ATP-dependent helicase/nuclease subunit B